MIHNTINLALKLPGGNEILQPKELTDKGLFDLASVISGLLNIAFYFGAFMAFAWLVWGAFQYILASGKKEELAKARERIKWALIGLMVILTAYLIATFASEILPPKEGSFLPF